MTTLAQAVAVATERLALAGVAEARLEARVLVAAAVGRGVEVLAGWPERELSADEASRLDVWLARRERREPLAQILGRREFWSLDFAVSAHVLTPRPDSETLIEAALARFAAGRVLDLGTGSGCLLLAILHERPSARGLGIDASPAALAVAQANAQRLDLAGRAEFSLRDWREGLAGLGRFDLVVANPPYIPDGDIAGLEPEVARFEPRLALAGGADGLDAYRAILDGLDSVLTPEGLAAFEVGIGQAEALIGLAQTAGWRALEVRSDLGGVARAVVIGKSSL